MIGRRSARQGGPISRVTQTVLSAADTLLRQGKRAAPRARYHGSKSNELNFAFAGGSNLDPTKDMHSGPIRIRDKNHVESEWDGYGKGQKVDIKKFLLTRE
jgi:hypothetical protein